MRLVVSRHYMPMFICMAPAVVNAQIRLTVCKETQTISTIRVVSIGQNLVRHTVYASYCVRVTRYSTVRVIRYSTVQY